jgi:hypothetical protein
MGQGQSSIPNEEVDALVDFYQALGGENKWKHKTGWCQPTIDPENWFGVEVMLGHVIGIELPANGLEGTIPESIARLPFLRVLDLSRNRIHGMFYLVCMSLCEFSLIDSLLRLHSLEYW